MTNEDKLGETSILKAPSPALAACIIPFKYDFDSICLNIIYDPYLISFPALPTSELSKRSISPFDLIFKFSLTSSLNKV